ncbi:hypothetical protein EBZ80_24990 [bacterium]|nr:hypothetical protein [bacterium]
MDLLSLVGNPRITDYSFRVADSIFTNGSGYKKEDLLALYGYHLGLCQPPNALYPQSNWQSHRICLLSAIAVTLRDTSRINQCDALLRRWIAESSCGCCDARSQDFHWRDSCEYVVYGWWALAKACVYLQSANKKPYKPLFNNLFAWLAPYQAGTKKHVEFVNSKNMPADLQKPKYNKPFDPNYVINLTRVYDLLKS